MANDFTPSEIRRRLEGGADGETEFTEGELRDDAIAGPDALEVAEAVVAFANADGGAFLLGVGDQGDVRGIPADRIDEVERWFTNLCTTNCVPPVRPRMLRRVVPNAAGEPVHLLVADVPKGLFVHRASTGRYLVRVGASKRELGPDELARLFQQRGRLVVFDEQPVPDAPVSALDERLVEAHFGRPIALGDPLLRKARIVVGADGDDLHPTVAGLLAYSRSPTAYLPSAFISAAVYRGTRLDSDELLDAREIVGPVTEQVVDARLFVSKHMRRPATRKVGREDHDQFDLGVVHEAIVNAVAHRDYSIIGSKIRLFLFSDRLEIRSPGGLPNTLTLDELEHRQFTRNQLLVSFLARLKDADGHRFIEARGEGVPKIYTAGQQWSGRRPEYKLHGQELALTIWAKPSPHDTDARVG